MTAPGLLKDSPGLAVLRARAGLWARARGRGLGVCQWRVLDLVLCFSAGLGREWAFLPARFFVALCGVSAKHVSDVTRGLVRTGALERQGNLYRLLEVAKVTEEARGGASCADTTVLKLVEELVELNAPGQELGAPGWLPGLDGKVREGQAVIVCADASEEGAAGEAGKLAAKTGARQGFCVSSVAPEEVSTAGAAGDVGKLVAKTGERVSLRAMFADYEVNPGRYESAFCGESPPKAVDRGKKGAERGSLVASRVVVEEASSSGGGKVIKAPGRGEGEFVAAMAGVLGDAAWARFEEQWRRAFGEDGDGCWRVYGDFVRARKAFKAGKGQEVFNAGAWMWKRLVFSKSGEQANNNKQVRCYGEKV